MFVGVGGFARVIANALANALGALAVEPRALPLTPSRVWHLVQEARQGLAAQ